jgi:putative transposase
MLKVVEKRDKREAGEELLLLDEIAREGARRMLMEALKAEVDDYVERHHSERDEQGHALVVRNGRAATRKLTLGAGTVEVRAPRVNDRRRDEHGHRQRFTSHILPAGLHAPFAEGRRSAAHLVPARALDRRFPPRP